MFQGNHKHLMAFMDKHFVIQNQVPTRRNIMIKLPSPNKITSKNISTKRKKPQKEITYLKLNRISLQSIMITIMKYLTKLLKAN